MRSPKTRYTKSGDVHIAYQTVGTGPVDFLLAPGSVSQLEIYWESPDLADWFQGVTGFARLILFDKRGTGLSDRAVGIPTLEERMDDIRAVMDAAASDRAVVFGLSEGATMSALFAATYPERTLGAILFGGFARSAWAPDYPWGRTAESFEAGLKRIETDWEKEVEEYFVSGLAPSRVGDSAYREWASRLFRFSATPASEIARRKMNREMDIRSILNTIQVPVLVLHPTDDRMVSVEQGRYLAEHIPGAKFVEYPGTDHAFWANPGSRAFVLREARSFVEGLRAAPESNRVLTTVLFTDLVGSTERASALGDEAWNRLLRQHFEASRQSISRFRGREVKRLGDGVLATFDGPTRAVRCACEIRDEVRAKGLEIRAGVHTGECLLESKDIHGVAVHLASRIMEEAGPGEVLVSSTVRDLSAGSGLTFVDRGARRLQGLEGEWQVYSAGPPAPLSSGT